jgi:hypothetical protein
MKKFRHRIVKLEKPYNRLHKNLPTHTYDVLFVGITTHNSLLHHFDYGMNFSDKEIKIRGFGNSRK